MMLTNLFIFNDAFEHNAIINWLFFSVVKLCLLALLCLKQRVANTKNKLSIVRCLFISVLKKCQAI